ncbi:TPA: hypothetical protein DCX16_05845 [bacterium]|nr:hypothetical protein [bacterium]
MTVELVDKDGVLFSGKAEKIVVPGVLGSMGILNNHTPLFSPLKSGKIKIDDKIFDVQEGFVNVSDNYVIILA